jgi:Sulfotransferase family
VVASIRRVGRQHGWGAHGIPGGTDTWERSARAADRWRRRLRGDQFLEVQYEHLVADPQAVLGRIVEFLHLDAAGLDAMLRHHETADIHSRTLHSLVSKPVTTEAVRTWEQALRPREIAFVQSVLGDWMRRYGYEPVAPGVKIPPELRQRYRRRRNEMRLESARRRARELGLRLTYRGPVSARP